MYGAESPAVTGEGAAEVAETNSAAARSVSIRGAGHMITCDNLPKHSWLKQRSSSPPASTSERPDRPIGV